jgi:intracellular septation protein A
MIETKEVYIPLNKRKLARFLRGSIINTLVGLWFFSRIWVNHSLFMILASGLGIVMIIFYVPLTYFLIKKWKDKRAGITVDSTGITDNTYLFSAVHIPWSGIQDIRKTRRTLLIIFIYNPVTYISAQSNFIKRKMLKMAFKHYGSPIIINSKELKGGFDELQSILQTELRENKSVSGQ